MYSTFAYLEQFRGKVFTGKLPTVLELFLVSEARFPNKNCFTSFYPETTILSFTEAKKKIFAVAKTLMDNGVKKGDFVALTGKNSIEWAVSYLGIIAAGGVVIPLDYQFLETEMENLIAFTDTRIIIIDEEKYDGVGITPGKDFVKFSLSKAKPNYIFDVIGEPVDKPVLVSPDDLAAILFTSGTTGNPKGVMLTHSNFVNDCLLAQMNLNIFHTDVFYAILPLHHSYSMLAVFIESISVGAEIVFGSKLVVTQMLADLKQGKVTMFLGVPMLFNRVLKGILKGVRAKGVIVYGIIRYLLFVSGIVKKLFGINIGKKLFKSVLDKASLSTIRICISGGGPLNPSTFKIYNQLGINFVQGYGLTETSPIAALNPVEHFKIKSVGKIIPGVEVKIVEPDSVGRGEIAIKGPIVMQGYYRNPEATKEVLKEDGFLYTGDVGYLDSENYLYLTGRKKSLIVTGGGKNVFPEEIEDKFQLCDEAEQVFVRGYLKNKNDVAEEIEIMFYPSEELRNNCTKEEIYAKMEKIVSEVNKQSPQYMWITKIGILDAPLEMTSTKKVKRHKVAK
ncbi:MAG: AMP-binding protein [Spirochaetes bacterium]|nr:AMP-binding protein [Spirochaetota bacterium]